MNDAERRVYDAAREGGLPEGQARELAAAEAGVVGATGAPRAVPGPQRDADGFADGPGHQPPAGVAANAKRALKLIADGKAGSGMTAVGRGRARQLASGRAVSLGTVRAMNAYFARHGAPSQQEDHSGTSPAAVAWLAWGGDAGKRWAAGVVRRADMTSDGHPDVGLASAADPGDPADLAAEADLLADGLALVAWRDDLAGVELVALDADDVAAWLALEAGDDGALAKKKRQNWVAKAGGLPKLIRRVADHLMRKGKTESHAIAIAVNVVKRYCSNPDGLNFPGSQRVKPQTVAKGCKAVAEWNRKRAQAKAS